MSKSWNQIQDYCLFYIVDNMSHARQHLVQEIFAVVDEEVSRPIEQVLLILGVLVEADNY